MSGLVIVVTRPSALRAALELAAASAALGGRTRLFCQGEAVAALALPLVSRHDPDHRAAGLPTLAELFAEALSLGVETIACQSGLALMGVTADMLDAHVAFGGPVSVLQQLGEDRLVAL